MEKNTFVESVCKASNFIVEYHNNVKTQLVFPNVTPGYLEKILDIECPEEGDNFDLVFTEFKEKLMPSVTHWASPHFHIYMPFGNCFSSMTAELLIAGINNIGINWESSPITAELENVVLDWLVEIFNLPKFLKNSFGDGGGYLQNSTTECTLISLLSARNRTIKRYKKSRPDLDEKTIANKLVIYTSNQSHFHIERLGKVVAMRTRILPSNSNGKLSGETLTNAIENDIRNDLFPCFLSGIMGATATYFWDDLEDLGVICKKYDVWFHVDAAYSGAALICPDLRYISDGIHRIDSFAIGLHKWFLMTYDVAAYWVRDRRDLSYKLDTGRRLKALKVWMVLMNQGVDGMQQHIRRNILLGRYMEMLIQNDNRFEVVLNSFGLVLFRLKTGDNDTDKLRLQIMKDKKIALGPGNFKQMKLIKYTSNYSTIIKDVEFAWDVIRKTTNTIFNY